MSSLKDFFKKNAGFTLIEVLIALAVLAIALLAIEQAVQSAIRIDARLKGKMIAHDIALSIASNLQAQVLSLPEETLSGTETVLNQSWQWQVGTISQDSHTSLVKIQVFSVLAPDNRDQLIAPVWKASHVH